MHPFCLRRTTVQPRLFQQACRLASTRRKVVKPRRTILEQQASRPDQQAHDKDDGEDSIRWFEKDVETGVIRRVAGNPEELEAKELRRKIQALEAELQEYKSEMSDADLMAALGPAERAKVERAMQQRDSKKEHLTAGLEVSLELPPLSVPLLKRLNASLHEAAINPHLVQRRKELWRWYCRAKFNIPALPQMMPTRAWEVLWETQDVQSPTNPERLQHTNQILEDMVSVGHPLTQGQRLGYIQTLVDLGKMQMAVQRWEDEQENDPEAGHKILQLGVSIFTSLGDVDRAHTILQDYLKRYPAHDPRIILVLIAANAKTGNDHMAFALYLLLRSKLGRDMTMDDYDAVALQFLNRDKKDLALAVFRDMMLQGNQSISDSFDQSKQDELYRAVFDRINLLRSSSANASEVNNISLVAMSAMPHQWQNKYFYASWLKKLIGLGQLDAASKVVEIMYERGVNPDTKHINGLVGAFLRSGDSDLHERGEALGWSMIQQRLDFTWRRRRFKRQETASVATSVLENEGSINIPTHISRTLPRASIETFNVLVLHYVVKQQWAHVHHLHRMLRPAEIKMESFFMNQLLQTELYTKDQQSAWRHFIKYARVTPPDLETYNVLWTAELRHLDRTKTVEDRTGFPPPRQLFSVMLTWLTSMDEKQKDEAKKAFDLDVYGKIAHSFCAEKDFEGCLVAIHALAQHFGQFPDHDIARVITTAVSNLPEAQVPSIRGRRGRQQMPVSQARLKNTATVLSALAQRRAGTAMEHGIDVQQLNPKERAEENLNLLSEFVRVVLVRSFGGSDAVEPSIEKAAREMGVPGIRTGDVDASNVS